ncbi:MAG: LysM peptidoglycan-binding domain-containing protein [Dysgonamonadaceae bacterium]|jgi:LysM repeat protein|nr:LysM peptidoglycan-binding domain-containing protein [Dysgonamonadaceae bacterium]
MSHRYFILLLFACLQFYNVKSGNAFYPESTFFAEDNNYFLHTVEKGQTVFSIASMYHISVDDIHKLNPQSKTLIKAGEKLKIPQESGSYIYHVIQPQETLYGLSRKYQMKGEDILTVNPGLSIQTFQIGKIIRIPVNQVTTPLKNENDAINQLKTNSLLHRTSSVQSVKTVQVALLLPFGLKGSEAGENMSGRMVEYYEGFLLALKALKSKGISINLQVHDIGSNDKEISNILKKEEMQNVHLIIGGVSDEQIKIISRFSNNKNIPYVIPFTSMSNESFNNPDSYQVNTPQSILYTKASTLFINKYENYHILLVSGEKDASNQSEFTGLLRSDMQEKKISFKTIPLKRFLDADFVSELDLYKDNVFVPDDDRPETIEKMIVPLRTIQRNHPECQISLFGYPRWQTYNSRYSDSFFQLHVSFFSVFYANLSSPEVKDFYNTFYKWYGRSISNNFPKFGILGYDTGMYFIQAVYTYGTAFETEINELKYKGIQTDFYLERVNNWGGFINTNLFLVNYNPDYSITQTSVK